MDKIDLHMHSTASDGRLSPEELVDWAEEKGLKAIAITDHEVFDGSRRALEYSACKNVEVVSGIEIGVDEEELGLFDIHVVGLFLDLENEELKRLSDRLRVSREVQKKAIIEKLNSFGYEVSFEELVVEANGASFGRPHIARILMRKYVEFETMGQVFDELLDGSSKANVRQEKGSMKEAVDIIHGAGGIAILAHPMLYRDFERVVERFAECGGDGIEVDYNYEGKRDVYEGIYEDVRRVALEYGLVVSGGGDFHSRKRCLDIGSFGLSEDEFEVLKGYWEGKMG